MILRFTLFLLCVLNAPLLFGQYEDCPLSKDLVDQAILLSEMPDFRIEPFELTSPGTDEGIISLKCPPQSDYEIDSTIREQILNIPLPLTSADSVRLEQLFDQLRITNNFETSPGLPESKSFWLSFNVIEAGNFEMIITPDSVNGRIGGNFDFLIVKGGCPSDPCIETVFCGSEGPRACYDDIIAFDRGEFEPSEYLPTGLADNPLLDYGVIRSADFPEVWESIELEAGENYYILIDHTTPDPEGLAEVLGFNACEFLDIGCTIQFGGSATIRPTQMTPSLVKDFPPQSTDMVNICKETSSEFKVDLLNYNKSEQLDFIWTFPADATKQGEGEDVQIFFGSESGEVCVEVGCPIQTTICWPIEIQLPADLQIQTPTPAPCEPLSIEDYVIDATDVDNLLGSLEIFDSRINALSLSNPLPLSIVNSSGDYWVAKKIGVCPADFEPFTAISTTPSLVVQEDTLFSCSLPYDLNQIAVDEANGFLTTGNLTISFHKNLDDANADRNPVLEADDYGTYYVKGQTLDDCKDILPIEIIDATPIFQTIQPIQMCNEVDISSFRPVSMDGIPANFITYFDNRAAAEDGSAPLSSTIITESQTIWARAEIAAGCPGFVPINIEIQQTTLDPIDPTSFCGDSYNLNNLSLNGADSYTFYGSEANAQDQTFDFDEVLTTTSVWVRGENTTTGCSDIISVELIAADPTINPISTINGCGSPFDLNSNQVALSEANGIGLTYSFYTSMANAETGANPITDGIIDNSGTYYVRGVTTGSVACYDVVEIDVNLVIPNAQLPSAQRLDNGVYDLQDVRVLDLATLNRLTNLTFFADSLQAVDGTPELPSSVVTAVGTYWIKGELNSCPVIVPQEILAESAATLTLPDLPILSLPCTGDCIDLATEVSKDDLSTNTSNLDIYFFSSIEEADDGLLEDTLQDLTFCDPTFVWVRGVDANGEFGVTSVQIGGRENISGVLVTPDNVICKENADQISLEFQLEGTAPFEVVYSDGNKDTTVISNTNTLTVNVSPDATTSYTLESITDAKGCSGVTNGRSRITLLEAVTIDDFEKPCNDLQTDYTISFEIQTGDLTSLNVNGISGTISGNRYISDPIPIEEDYAFTVSDANGCASFEDNGNTVCQCFTEAATLDLTPINTCIDKVARANIVDAGVMTVTDKRFYVLHTSNADQIGEVLLVQEEPDLTYTDPLELETIYYFSSVITKENAQGEPILDASLNPCIGVSRGVPIQFFDIPEVSISLDKNTACPDEEVNLVFEMNAQGPFNVNVFGKDLMELTNIENGHIEPVQVSTTTDFIVEYIEFSEVQGCLDETPIGSTALEVFEAINYEGDLEPNCDPGGREFTISFTITGGDPDSYRVEGSVEGTLDGNIFTSEPIPHKSNYRFDITDGNNCEPTMVQGFGECLCTSDITTSISQIQAISCPDTNDGAVEVTAQNGLPPYTFQWQDGPDSELFLGLGQGMVYVSMTDANDCVVTDSFLVEGPDAIVPEIIMNPPLCFGDENGSIIIRKVNGGTKPFEFFFNSSMPSTSQLYGNLTGQDYPLGIIDANGCEYRDTLLLEDPEPLTVSLLNNTKKLNLGDSIEIDTRVSHKDISFVWTSNAPLSCTDCLNPTTKPTTTGIYSITITNEFDCTASDELVIQVSNDKSFYAPTVFSPNGDGINDTFGIFGGSQVSNINSLKVFNRWGAMLYNRTNLGQQVPFEDGWDGMETNGNKAPSGIYVYMAEIVYADGTVEVVTGDVALMR